MSLSFYIEKANPLWDGDGVQGAGQPRGRMGRWIKLPGTTLLKKIGAWELEDGTFGVFKDGEEEPFKTFKTKKAADNFVNKAIKEDVDSYVRDKVIPKERAENEKHRRERMKREQEIVAEGAKGQASRRERPVLPPQGKEPAKSSRRVTVDPVARLTLPATPTLDQRNRANSWASQNLPKAEAKYAGLISRLAGKGITQDPTKRGELSQKYGIPAGRMVEVEQEVYAQMFPTKVGGQRRRNLGGGAVGITEQQRNEMLKHGALKATVLSPGEDGSPYRPERFFKATKGPMRGKFVKVSWNGVSSEMEDDEAIDAAYESKIYWTKRMLRNSDRMKRVREQRAEENRALREKAGEDAAIIKESKIIAAKRWAESQGFDPDDSFWWGFFWNDQSLVKGGGDQEGEIAEGTKALQVTLGEVMEHEKMDPKLLEGILSLPDDFDTRKMRGFRPGSKRAIFGDEDFEEASPEAREVDPEWEAKSRDQQIAHNRRIKAAYDRYKKKHPNTKMSIEEFTDDYYNNRMRIPGGARGIKKRLNPFWDGDGVQGRGQPRDHTGKWVKLPGKSHLNAIGVWELEDGNFGVYGKFIRHEERLKKYKTKRDALKAAAKEFEKDSEKNVTRSIPKSGNPKDVNGVWGKWGDFDGKAMLFSDDSGVLLEGKTVRVLYVTDRKRGYGSVGMGRSFNTEAEVQQEIERVKERHIKRNGPIVNEKAIEGIEPTRGQYDAGQFWSLGVGYQAISNYLRNGVKLERKRYGDRYDHSDVKTAIRHLDAYMKKNKNKEEFTAYRGVYGDFADLILGLKVGDEFTDNGYVAVAKNKQFADYMQRRQRAKVSKVTFEVVVPKGIGTMDLDKWRYATHNPGPEQEVVIERGMTFKVVYKRAGVIRVKAVKAGNK